MSLTSKYLSGDAAKVFCVLFPYYNVQLLTLQCGLQYAGMDTEVICYLKIVYNFLIIFRKLKNKINV